MSLKDVMVADTTIFLNTDEFADIVAYNGVDIKVVVEPAETQQRGNEYSNEGTADRAYIWVSATDVPEPKPLDTINNWRQWRPDATALGDTSMVIGGEADTAGGVYVLIMGGVTWQVANVVESDGAMHKLLCVGNSSPWPGR